MIGKPTTGIIQIHNLANDNGYRALRQNKTEKNEDRESEKGCHKPAIQQTTDEALLRLFCATQYEIL